MRDRPSRAYHQTVRRHRLIAALLLGACLALDGSASCTIESPRGVIQTRDQVFVGRIDEVLTYGQERFVRVTPLEIFKGHPRTGDWLYIYLGFDSPWYDAGRTYLIATTPLSRRERVSQRDVKQQVSTCGTIELDGSLARMYLPAMRRWAWAWRHTPEWMYQRTYRDPWFTVGYWPATNDPAQAFRAEVEASGAVWLWSGRQQVRFSIPPADLAELHALLARDSSTIRIASKRDGPRESRSITGAGLVDVYIDGDIPGCNDEDAQKFVKLWNEVLTIIAPLPRVGRELRVPGC